MIPKDFIKELILEYQKQVTNISFLPRNYRLEEQTIKKNGLTVEVIPIWK